MGASYGVLALLVALLGASWSLLACLACFLGLSCAILVDLGLILVDLGAILVDLGSIFADLATLRIELSPARELDFHVFVLLLLEISRSFNYLRISCSWATFGALLGALGALLRLS